VHRLTTRFAVATAVLVVVSLGALSVLAITVGRHTVRSQIQSGNTTSAGLAARAFEQYVLGSVRIVEEASQRPKLSREIRAANWPEASRVLENIAQHFDRFAYLFVQDTQGVIRVRVPYAKTVGQDFSFRDFFQEAVRTRHSYVSGVYVSRATQQRVVTVAVPVTDGAGGLAGVLCAALSLDRMSEVLLELGRDRPSRMFVVDRQGILVGDSRGLRDPEPVSMADRPIVQAVLAGRAGSMEFREPGSDQLLLGAYVPIAGLGWGIVAVTPTAIAYATVTRLAWGMAGISVTCTVATLFVGLVLTRRLTRPLRRLSEATEQVAGGDFQGAQVRVDGRDEVAALATAFNQMAARIAASQRALEDRAREVTAAHDSLARELDERRRGELEIRRLNEELEQRVQERTRELAAANGELEAFSYSVAHDLRAPLRAMDGFSRILAEQWAPTLEPDAQRLIGRVRANATQMGALVDDLLAFSRLGRQALKRGPVAPDALVREAWAVLHAEEEGRHVELTIGSLPVCQGDSSLLKQVFINLLGNALKFTRKRDVAQIEVGCRTNEGESIYFVRDNGVGFDMRYASKLFGVFQRQHRMEEYEGTGVGLAIVQRIVHRHGGRVWAEAAVDAGAVIFFTLEGRGPDG
jgi:signal transduction histidine kinase